ncbi:MAG TPA: AMP nucleosidase [Actinomycetales bacterium]|nr:AMP nucleosidase [Actinomycetales bacterium]
MAEITIAGADLTGGKNDPKGKKARRKAAARLLEALIEIDASGRYPRIEVVRPWSDHNPIIVGEMARPGAIDWYLTRELKALLKLGAQITVAPSRQSLDFDDPLFFDAVDEQRFDLRAKKLFLFGPERMALSLDRLAHYTGTPAESFQRHVLFTNYRMHVEAFLERFPDAERPHRDDVQMPAYHAPAPDSSGVTLINIGVGPSNAKTATDHVAVLRPDTMMMIGHCGGLRNRQRIGDYVVATGFLRKDHVLDEVLPTTIPVVPTARLNRLLIEELEARGSEFRMGTVYTTADRNWELNQQQPLADMRTARCVAVDMESATVAANGFRYRIPNATLLCVSDKPMHAAPKLAGAAAEFYSRSKQIHLDIALATLDRVRELHPRGLPTQDIRSYVEPLIGAE